MGLITCKYDQQMLQSHTADHQREEEPLNTSSHMIARRQLKKNNHALSSSIQMIAKLKRILIYYHASTSLAKA